MSGRLIAPYKHPNVRPVGIRETWICLFSKCVMMVMGPEATNSCQYDHICAGLKAGIDSTVHGVRDICDADLFTDDLVFKIVGAKNYFDEIKHIGMLWIFFHLWLSGAHFVFNWYRHWSILPLLNGNRTARFLHSREVLMQGDPPAMIAHYIFIILIIKWLKAKYPDVTQPCYADDNDALGTFTKNLLYFNYLKTFGLGHGYYPKQPKKCWPYTRIISNPENGLVCITGLSFARRALS